MTDHRSDTVRLADGEPRCEPRLPCWQKATCARYLAAVPAQYATWQDFSASSIVSIGGAVMCIKYRSADAARKPAAAPAPAPKPHIRGL